MHLLIVQLKLLMKHKPIQLFAYAEEKPFTKPATGNKTIAQKKLKYTTSISGGTQDLLTPLTLKFSNKLKNFDSLKIQLTDTLFNPIPSVAVSIDTTEKEVVINNNWIENADYRLLLQKILLQIH